jgi:hypothetical protein
MNCDANTASRFCKERIHGANIIACLPSNSVVRYLTNNAGLKPLKKKAASIF